MSTTPQYVGTPKNGTGQASVANTNRDGTGTLATVHTAGASGARVDMLRIQATGTTTAGMIRLFLDVGGTIRLIGEIPVVAVTPSATQPAWAVDYEFPRGLVMQANAVLKASTHNAETFNLIPTLAGDF